MEEKRRLKDDQETRRLQEMPCEMVPRAAIGHLIREIIREIEQEKPGIKFRIQGDAMRAMHTAAEDHVTTLMEATSIMTQHAKRQTMMIHDLLNAVRVYDVMRGRKVRPLVQCQRLPLPPRPRPAPRKRNHRQTLDAVMTNTAVLEDNNYNGLNDTVVGPYTQQQQQLLLEMDPQMEEEIELVGSKPRQKRVIDPLVAERRKALFLLKKQQQQETEKELPVQQKAMCNGRARPTPSSDDDSEEEEEEEEEWDSDDEIEVEEEWDTDEEEEALWEGELSDDYSW
jgi:histone H3/H4